MEVVEAHRVLWSEIGRMRSDVTRAAMRNKCNYTGADGSFRGENQPPCFAA